MRSGGNVLQVILDFLKSIIEGGFVGQAVIATIVWAVIGTLLVRQQPIDDRVFDAGFIILGYFFHVAQMAASTNRITKAKNGSDAMRDELNKR